MVRNSFQFKNCCVTWEIHFFFQRIFKNTNSLYLRLKCDEILVPSIFWQCWFFWQALTLFWIYLVRVTVLPPSVSRASSLLRRVYMDQVSHASARPVGFGVLKTSWMLALIDTWSCYLLSSSCAVERKISSLTCTGPALTTGLPTQPFLYLILNTRVRAEGWLSFVKNKNKQQTNPIPALSPGCKSVDVGFSMLRACTLHFWSAIWVGGLNPPPHLCSLP